MLLQHPRQNSTTAVTGLQICERALDDVTRERGRIETCHGDVIIQRHQQFDDEVWIVG